MTEPTAATLAVRSSQHASCGRRKLAAFRCRGLSRQPRRGCRMGHSSMKRGGCCCSAPPGGFSGWDPDIQILFSTGTSLPPLCRTWKGELEEGEGGTWLLSSGSNRHPSLLRFQSPLSSRTCSSGLGPTTSRCFPPLCHHPQQGSHLV